PPASRQTITTQAQLRSFDVRTRLQFHAGPVLLDVTGGSTVNQRVRALPFMQDTLFSSARSSAAQLWGRTEAQVPLSRWLSVRAGIAALPTQSEIRSPVRAVYSLSMQVAKWRRDDPKAAAEPSASPRLAFEAALEDSLHLRLRFRHPDAATVRVSGEPTRWEPVSMTRVREDWWEVVLPVGAGTYRLNISIDDAPWQPPPGLPTARDEFGGRVGLVTVR
ncbi:MAG TPA: glycogen-binding domain-containing protein, partial [Gemmatimonas sp.]|uniref:glycogen-binding domain-containing protein n=1 Tax=Gemmatimonas sp. TaxID=1962908 RepID=UPI002ED87886